MGIKISGYVKTFKVEDKINESMSFRIDDEKLLQKCKVVWAKIAHLINIQLNGFTSLWW